MACGRYTSTCVTWILVALVAEFALSVRLWGPNGKWIGKSKKKAAAA